MLIDFAFSLSHRNFFVPPTKTHTHTYRERETCSFARLVFIVVFSFFYFIFTVKRPRGKQIQTINILEIMDNNNFTVLFYLSLLHSYVFNIQKNVPPSNAKSPIERDYCFSTILFGSSVKYITHILMHIIKHKCMQSLETLNEPLNVLLCVVFIQFSSNIHCV